MSKYILIFSDGTGQVGGVKPDQKLSNVYKMYRAMRPGPSSPISPMEQIAFYDPGLGSGEDSGINFKRIRNILESALGIGIDENVIDCYEAVISNYEPGDKICFFGFSRGAYTVRSLANVMNLCGIPTKMPNGEPVPKYGKKLRKIATDAVMYVYNHGAGKKREEYEEEREEKARRFRKRYSSEGTGADGEAQGNVQPTFIGVFDTVAALGSKFALFLIALVILLLLCALYQSYDHSNHFIFTILLIFTILTASWGSTLAGKQFKYFYKDPKKHPSLYNPLNWPSLWKNGHFASWNRKNYDCFLDNKVRFARHAVSIDENRKSFPRVPWGSVQDMERNKNLKPEWFKQVWFPGNHSDIGGSYPENESRLSDIALKWMLDELKEALPDIKIRKDLIHTTPDPLGLQHDEVLVTKQKFKLFTWKTKKRAIGAPLHDSVQVRMNADYVPTLDGMKKYDPFKED